MRFAILACLAAIILATSIPTIAQQPPESRTGGGSQVIARFDKDGDGAVSKTEFGGPDSMFAKLDTDGDGLLSADELRGVRERDIMFAKADANTDGKVTLEEFLKYQEQLFSELDKDESGALSSDEFAAGLGGRAGQQGQSGDSAAMAQMMLQRMDSDGDGKISQDEWRGPQEGFASADTNSDGYIDSTELSQTRRGFGGPGQFGGRRRGDGQDGGQGGGPDGGPGGEGPPFGGE